MTYLPFLSLLLILMTEVSCGTATATCESEKALPSKLLRTRPMLYIAKDAVYVSNSAVIKHYFMASERVPFITERKVRMVELSTVAIIKISVCFE